MKKNVLPLALLFFSNTIHAQVGIGTLTPNTSSQLEIVSSNKGILIPRVSLMSITDATTISNGNVNSLMVFNTSTTETTNPGYYYWYVDKWLRIVNEDDFTIRDKNTRNVSLTVDTDNLILTDTDGNSVTISLNEINFEETITTLSYDSVSGIITYINEEDHIQTIDLKSSIKNFETKTSLTVNPTNGTIEYTDENDVEHTLSLINLIQLHQTITN